MTAQKREERLLDVPVPVTAVAADDMLAQNQTKAQEFFASVPGVNLQFQNSRAQLAIRGIATGPVSGNPVVGYTIDDVPFGSSTGQGGLFGAAPDLDPSDLERIEVLRGPQGTLYGAASIGGLVKYVTVDPDLGAFSGVVGGGLSTIHGGDVGYNARGALNVPLGETVAVRASAFTREEAGYIDNVRTGEDNVNTSQVTGARLALLWEPSDAFSINLGAMYQTRDIYGSSNVDVTTGSFYQQTDQIGSGRSSSDTQMYTAAIEADLGGVDLTSISAYSRATNYDFLDFTASPLVGFLFPSVFPDLDIADLGDIFRQGYNVNKFSHETRLSGSVGENFDFIVGGFYTNEDGNYDLDNYAIVSATGTSLGKLVIWRDLIKYEEYAAFANFTARFSEQFDVQFGGRYSHNDQQMSHNESFQGLPFPEDPFLGTNNPEASGSAFTYQISPRFRPNDDHMVYARLATGYRPGGPNPICGAQAEPVQVPCEFKPDKVINFELGAKGEVLDGQLTYDFSLYNIDWNDIQIVQVLDVFTYNGNAGKARSRGFELALAATPADGLTVSAWWSYVDAVLLEEFVDANFFAEAGDRLPFSSKHSGRFAADYEAQLADDVTGSLGASATYVGGRRGEFVPFAGAAALRAQYPGYVQFDVRAGLEFDNWKLNLFVQNLTNKHGVIGGGFWNQTTYNQNWFNYSQPRTVGLNAELQF
ncbi:MAG: TonB-dependent receptor [Alteraurantiacibacter sp.]